MHKIAHICTAATSHKILCDKLSILKSYGYDIHFISSREGLNREFMEGYDFTFKFVDMKRHISLIGDIKSVIDMTKLIAEEKYDLVHTHTAKAGIIGRVAAKLARTPIILHTYHGLPFYTGQRKFNYYVYQYIEYLATFISHGLASQNGEDMRVLEKMTKKPVYYEGNGVDIERLDRIRGNIDEKVLDSIRHEYNISVDKQILFIGARLEPVKDPFYLLEGLKKLKDMYKNFVCLIAGRGPLENEIVETIRAYGLGDHVKVIGFKENIYPYLCLADMVLLTSKKEGIPRIIMEAMAFSKPVIGTDVLGTRELVVHKETGLLVPYRNIDKLATSILTLLQDHHLRRVFGKNARRRIESHFTEQLVANRINQYYQELIELVR